MQAQGRQSIPHDHRTAELRSLAFHSLVAERLDAKLLNRAQARVDGWLATNGPVDHRWAEKWQELLNRPIPEIKRRLNEDSEEMRDLRQSTPFAGAISESERQEILREVR
jgi:hypothetical protein